MSVLGLDTATGATAVALLLDDDVVIERRHDPGPGDRPAHGTALLDLVAEVLALGGGWAGVERIAVGTGPGSFTGLRIGVAAARALAQGRGLGVVGVSTLRALCAAEAPVDGASTLAVLDARRGEVFAGAWTQGGARETLAVAALAPATLAERVAELEPSPLAVGDGAVRFRAELEPTGATIPPDDDPRHRVSAAAICRLGREAQAAGREGVLPDYVRLPDAEIARRRRTDSPSP